MRVVLCAECRARLDPDRPFCLPCWVQESCREQGVPVKVTDPSVVHQVAVLLGAPGGRRG